MRPSTYHFSALSFLLLSLSTWSWADSVKSPIQKFSISILSHNPAVLSLKTTLKLEHQYCNFFKTSCAGGPSEKKNVDLELAKLSQGPSFYLFKNPKNFVFSSSFWFNQFSSCSASLLFRVETSRAEFLEKEITLSHKNGQEFCSSNQFNDEILRKIGQPFTLEIKDSKLILQ